MKVYLSKDQYRQLLRDGSITVGTTTVVYNEDDDYITPIEDVDASQFVKSTTLQNKVYVHDHEKDTTIAYSSGIVGKAFVVRDGVGNIKLPTDTYLYAEDSAVPKSYVDGKVGGGGKLYRHNITLSQSNGNVTISFQIIASKATQYGSINNLKDNIPVYTACVIQDTMKNPTHYSGTIYSAIDAGDNSIAIMMISTYSTSGISTTAFNNIITDVIVDL